ncbi:MAG TPA: efflux RND transporter periplasmic adaptor subunit [Gammaproteobacteria bacterium]|jgi:membrane fusion protein (multidrug efflux system)|nr:efflux RND transporter periplasmic adaptor subunit [Gammaproteobacteria bacterium]
MSFPSTLVLAAAAAMGLCACAEGPANKAARSAGNNVPRVVTAVAHVEPMGLEIEAVGTAQAKESVQVTSKVSNTVTAIRFKEGAEVAEGTVLVEMQDTEARAALAEAEAALARSRSQFDRSRDLQSRQALSVADLEQVEAALKADQARVAAAQSRLDDTVIRAAFRGRTGFRRVSVGSYVSPGTVITTLDDTSIIKLDFTIPETMLYVVRRGLPITARATGLPDRVFMGEVTNMDSRVDPVTRSIAVRAELPNADGMLRQGMFLTVSLKGELEPTLLVPEEAIVPERGKAYVFVVQDNVVHRREVRTGKRRPGEVEIIEGVREHEHVVVEGTQNIRDGVTVQETSPPSSPS